MNWFSARPAPPLTDVRVSEIGWILRVTTALLLIGHGGFDFRHEQEVDRLRPAVGISPDTLAAHPFTPLAGWFELALGLLVLAWPKRGLLLFVFAWKLGTDAFRPLAGEPIWEFIERGGSYGAPLALAWVQGWRQTIAAGAHRAMSLRSLLVSH